MRFPQPPAGDPWSLTARWIFPVDRPPMARGTITIQNEQIVAVEPKGARTADVDLGNVAILPGFVNAHTHLDLSDALGKCPPGPDFCGWLRSVIAHRRRQTPEDVQRAIETGIAQCLRYGTTLVGDISAGGASWDQLAKAPIQAVVFFELIGLTKERADRALADAHSWLKLHQLGHGCRPGLSPHAPYSVRASVFGGVEWKNPEYWKNWSIWPPPLAIHVSESVGELELLDTHSGPFVAFLKGLGAWDPDGLLRSEDYVLQFDPLGAVVGRKKLYIHCNYLKPQKLPGTLIYCPRTHAAFGHPPHPFREFLVEGTPVALGTDSLASNPDLDPLAEARFVHAQYSDVPSWLPLRMVTLSGAWALGMDDTVGSLTPRKLANLVVLPLPDSYAADPHSLILESSLPIDAAMFHGRWVYLREERS